MLRNSMHIYTVEAATLGDQHFGRYIEVAFIDGLFCAQTVHLGPGCLAVTLQLAFIQGWPLRGGFHSTYTIK